MREKDSQAGINSKMDKNSVAIILGTAATVLIFFFAPMTFLSIEDIKPTYKIGEQITFTINQQGCGLDCHYHELTIINETGVEVWKYAQVRDGVSSLPNILFSYKQHFDQNYVGDVTLDTLGKYKLKLSTRDLSVTKEFKVETANSQDFVYPKPGIVYYIDLVPASSWENQEEFAQRLASITNDKIIEKRIDDESHVAYTTQKGNLIIEKGQSLDFSQLVEYGLYGEHTIPKEDAVEFFDKFLREIGYQRDGSEWVQNVDYGSYFEIVIQQRKDGWIINNEITKLWFWPDNTQIFLGRWYNNINEIKIHYSQDDAKKIAFEYSKSLKDQNLQECEFVPSSGANFENMYLSYSSSTTDALRQELTQKAIENAQSRAMEIIGPMGLQIKGIKSIEVSTGIPQNPYGNTIVQNGIGLRFPYYDTNQANEVFVSVTVELEVGK